MGGGDDGRQAVELRLVDELRLYLVPVLLGAGTPLFSGGESRLLVQESVRLSPPATHLT
ncbi:MAG: dihydrofolate reductase family protein, partial [Acidimicrobiia bacterium]